MRWTQAWRWMFLSIVALACGSDPTAPPLADISGAWGARLPLEGTVDSLALTLHQAADGTLTGDGVRVLFGLQLAIVASGERDGTAIELHIDTTPVPGALGPDTLRAQVGATTLRGEFISGPFHQAVVLRRQ